jgi:hypothetical protein
MVVEAVAVKVVVAEARLEMMEVALETVGAVWEVVVVMKVVQVLAADLHNYLYCILNQSSFLKLVILHLEYCRQHSCLFLFATFALISLSLQIVSYKPPYLSHHLFFLLSGKINY